MPAPTMTEPKLFRDTTLRKFYRELRDFPVASTGRADAWYTNPVVLTIIKPDGEVLTYSDHANWLIDSVVDRMNFIIMCQMGHQYRLSLGPRDPKLYERAVASIRTTNGKIRRT